MSKLKKKSAKSKPIVGIVGRPNVGKSTLFNRIIGSQKAIVEDIPGVTRDRIYGDAEWLGTEFTIVDTGGFEPESKDIYLSLIKSQVEVAIKEADLILFVLDGRTDVMPQDIEVLRLLRRSEKPIIYVVNKIDHEKHELRTVDFHAMGVDSFITVSAAHGRKVDELLDAVIEKLPQAEPETVDKEENPIKVAVVGKPNVGKSTLVNKILGEERLLTSPLPGTTRDSIDTLIQKKGKNYLFVDTAGIRRKSKITFSVERYSVNRAIKTIERADIVFLMLDAQEGPTHQDARLSDLIHDRGKGCVVLLNKWDLVPKKVAETQGIEDITMSGLKEIEFAPIISISALTGKRVEKVFEIIDLVYENFSRRVPTRQLNNLLNEIKTKTPPPLHGGREIKFYYISQPMTKPPSFVVFTNFVKGISENYKKFLENRLREEFELEGTPIRIIFRANRKK